MYTHTDTQKDTRTRTYTYTHTYLKLEKVSEMKLYLLINNELCRRRTDGRMDGQTDRHTILAPDISIEQLASE